MKRSELTSKAMADMGWRAMDRNNLPMKDIVFNIQSKNEDGSWFWKLRTSKSRPFTKDEFGMCSTYEVKYVREYLEVMDSYSKKWYDIAERDVEIGRKCVYAD